MVNITLVEVHLDGAEFTANAPWSGEEPEAESDAAASEGGGPPLGLFVVATLLTVLVGAVAAKKVRGGDETDLDAIEDDIQ